MKDARAAKEWTQWQLADVAIMSRSHIAAIETGTRYPSEDDAKRLDQALGAGNVLVTFRPGQKGSVPDRFDRARQLEQ